MPAATLPTGTLFGRAVAVTVASPDNTGVDLAAPRFTGLRSTFKVTRSSQPEPNKIDITITNLSAGSRAKLQLVRGKGAVAPPAKVILEAGYQDNLQVVCRADIRNITHERHGADWITHLQCTDGGAAWAGARTSISFAPGTPIDRVISKLAADLGVGVGNLQQQLAAGNFKVTHYAQGYSASGLASRELNRVLQAAGLEWSVQDGLLQILPAGGTVQTTAYLLNASTGLIGSPMAGENSPMKGVTLKVKTLLLPSLRPGMPLQLDAIDTKGLYRIQKCDHTGDTHGQDWCSELEVVRIA